MACYLCGSEQSTRRKNQVRDSPNSQIHECAECDLVYLSACEPENLTAFYQDGGMHVQRYLISNHLYWLSRGNPGGHDHWAFLDSPEMDAAYENTLARIGKTDTLIACLTH